MTSSGNTWTRVAGPMATTVRPRKYAVGWYRLASWLFGHGTVCETVATRLHFDASPAAVWNHIMFYRKFPDDRRSCFARCYPAQSGPMATRPALGQSSAAHIERGIC